jgi:hypothetical protein
MSDSQYARSVATLARSIERLREALEQPGDNPLAVDGTIQRFELAIEPLWQRQSRLAE